MSATDTVKARSSGGPDRRGSVVDRRRRKRWLLDTYGDGQRCPCWQCGATLTRSTITVDRIIPQAQGGTYARDNIRPACLTCNCKRGAGDPDAYRAAGFTSPL